MRKVVHFPPLPPGMWPRIINREELKMWLDISDDGIDRRVRNGRLPPPRCPEGIELWDRYVVTPSARPKSYGSLVYFVQARRGGPIKIGVAQDVAKRVATLQCASSEKLVVLLEIDGGKKMEAKLHRRFSEHRLRGEWFYPAPAILRFIERESNEVDE